MISISLFESWGSLKEPTLPVPAGEPPTSSVDARASRSSPGVWSEDLGRFGSEPWHLPGFGDSSSRCGQWFPESVCASGHVHMNTHSCGRRSCPECWTGWASESSVRAARRLQAFRHTEPDNHRRQVVHAVVSPPEGDVMNERQYFDGRSKASDIAESKGFRGFAVIPHPWRPTSEGKKKYAREVPRDAKDNPKHGIWVFLRRLENTMEYVNWSPHYHIVGVTTRDMEPAKESDEWSYTFIRSLESYNAVTDSRSHNGMYGLFRYLLSHTGFPAGSQKQIVTWYGSLANAVFVEYAGKDWQIEKPSESVLNALERNIRAVAGLEDNVDDGDEDDADDCLCEYDGCDCRLIDAFDIPFFLDMNEVEPDVADTMMAVYDWRLGNIVPPPGLQNPRSESDAFDALEALI